MQATSDPAELRFAVPERMGPDGPLLALDPMLARELIGQLAAAEPEAVAVSLLHSYADPAHERLLGELLEELAAAQSRSDSHRDWDPQLCIVPFSRTQEPLDLFWGDRLHFLTLKTRCV